MKSKLFVLTAAVLVFLVSCENPFFPDARVRNIVPDYEIGLSDFNLETGINIGTITAGEEVQPLEITIKNTGKNPTGDLTITTSGDDNWFTLKPDTIPNIDPGESGSFIIEPNENLPPGEYSVIITITGGNGIEIEFEVRFVVEEPELPYDPSKLDPDVTTWPAGFIAATWQTLSTIPLHWYTNTGVAGTFTWTTPENPVGATGTRAHNMTFTPTDTSNYNTVTNNINITVQQNLAEMVYVEGGSFMFGRNGATGGTLTPVDSFSIGKYQVTQEQWFTVMTGNTNNINASPSNFSSDPAPGEVQGRRPVEMVSWYDVLVFCNRLSIREGFTPAYSINDSTDPDDWGPVPTSNSAIWNAVTIVPDSTGYRLPTERQWEFAAKGGRLSAGYTGANTDTYFIYSGSDNADAVAWHRGNSGARTREVGRLDANELGLHDMSGNIWEWCWDLSGGLRVIRGGCWNFIAQYTRSAIRLSYWPDGGFINFGFRLSRP
jgi:formylglycine-generating enzyme required for sulfatase activity